jgi:hypothetical protein
MKKFVLPRTQLVKQECFISKDNSGYSIILCMCSDTNIFCLIEEALQEEEGQVSIK